MFDSLNRHMLRPYGCDWIHAPNFERLAEKTVKFAKAYAGSLPCMPARRELHTGRYNFLHRSWGPLEPFDDSMPQILKQNGVYTHLVTDHYHYWEDNAATYHSKFNTWESIRGQEGDAWKGEVADPEIPESLNDRDPARCRQDWINRQYMQTEERHPLTQTVELGIEFMRKNKDADKWFLQLECFSPHEPFFSMQKYKDLYLHDYSGPHYDWPSYKKVNETEEIVNHVRYEYAAIVSMCDNYLGKVLDEMDALNLWEDTMLIVNTDHGFLLGEHGWWGKNIMPLYNEIANIPLFIWDPRSGKKAEQNDCLVQTIDIPPTILEFFGVDIPENMTGKSLKNTIANNEPIRKAALFGIHGEHVNCTDGKYVYMRAPVNEGGGPLYHYTLLPTFGFNNTPVQLLQDMELVNPFPFTKGCKLLKIKSQRFFGGSDLQDLLFDIETDPKQQNPIEDKGIEKQMQNYIVELMKEHDAPAEQYERLGLTEVRTEITS